MKTYKKGISLIVLVITIIVMAILATSIILTLSDTNIIQEANDTVEEANKKQVHEAAELACVSYLMDRQTSDTVEDLVQKLNSYLTDDTKITTDASGNLTENSTLISGEMAGYGVKIMADNRGNVSVKAITTDSSVAIAQELQIGDYVNYVAPAVNYTVSGQDSGMYTFFNSYVDSAVDSADQPYELDTSKLTHVDSTTGNQTFGTYAGRWQVLSVANGNVTLINEDSLGMFAYYNPPNLDTILDNIATLYVDENIAVSGRSIEYQDFVDGLMANIPTSSSVRVPGYTYCLGMYNAWWTCITGGLWYDWEGSSYEDPSEYTGSWSLVAPAIWLDSGLSNLSEFGTYSTGYLEGRAGDGVRAIITLKSDLTFKDTGTTVNGTPVYDIVSGT